MKLAGSLVLIFVMASIAVLNAAPPISPAGPKPNLPPIQGTTPPQPVTMTSSPVCTSSKTVVLIGQRGLGCRETAPTVWQRQGCTAAMGCCTAAGGCQVTSPTNAIKGDGIY